MARFLVTGAAGFIGSHVVARLCRDGHEVVGLDNVNDAYDVRLKELRLRSLAPLPGWSLVRGDLRDERAVAQAVEGADAVLHLGARAGVSPSVAHPAEYFSTNVMGTVSLLEACRRADVKRVLLASTSSVYPASTPRPFREDAPTDAARTPYAASKKAAEVVLSAYAEQYGFDAPVARLFTVYGPAGRPELSVFRFARWIREGEPVRVHGDGTQKRDFTYVDDVVRGILLASEKVRGHEVVNLGGGQPASILDVIGKLEKIVGSPARIERGPPMVGDIGETSADVAKARRLLGWSPQTSLDEGLRKVVEWYEANRAVARELRL